MIGIACSLFHANSQSYPKSIFECITSKKIMTKVSYISCFQASACQKSISLIFFLINQLVFFKGNHFMKFLVGSNPNNPFVNFIILCFGTAYMHLIGDISAFFKQNKSSKLHLLIFICTTFYQKNTCIFIFI